MEIDYNWTYNQTLRHIRKVKYNYKRGLNKISPDDYKSRRAYVKSSRDEIYKLKIKLTQTEALWSYMNDDIDFRYLIGLASRKEDINGNKK